jgi:calcium-dependent protein kinase
VPSSSFSYDYASYAEALLAHGGSPPGSRARFRRHRNRPPITAAGRGPSPRGSSPDRSSTTTMTRKTTTPFGPRPDVTRPLAKSLLGKTHPDDVAALYEAERELGRGQFGVARLARCRSTGAKVAVKSIDKRRLKGVEHLVDVRREVEVLRHLTPHPRIVRLLDALEDERSVHLVLELCKGGELVDVVAAAGRFTERDAAVAMRALLEAVAFCHEMGVCHRDLKLDNLLIAAGSDDEDRDHDDDKNNNNNNGNSSSASPSPPSSLSSSLKNLKTNDFGLSAFVRDGDLLKDLCGTAFYVAPEILEGKYYCGKSADVWACGVILYIMLSGQPPFYAERDEDVFRQILAPDGGHGGSSGPSFGDRVWDSVSTPAIEAVQKMMQRDPSKRPTAAEMLRGDSWVREGGAAEADPRPLQPEVLRRMQAFSRHNRLRREAMLLVAESLPAEEIAGLRALFDDYDRDGDGMITPAELREGLLRKGSGQGSASAAAAAAEATMLPLEALERIVALADVDHDRCLSVDEFIASTLTVQRAGLRQRLEAAFARFDADGDGYATRDEVRAALAALQGRRRRRRERRERRERRGSGDDDEEDADEDASSSSSSSSGGDDLAALTRAELSVLKADVDAVFAEADRDGDGRISRDEFFALMEAPMDDAAVSAGVADAFGSSGGSGDVLGGAPAFSGLRGGINRRSLAAARRRVEQMKQQQQQQAVPPATGGGGPLPVSAHA